MWPSNDSSNRATPEAEKLILITEKIEEGEILGFSDEARAEFLYRSAIDDAAKLIEEHSRGKEAQEDKPEEEDKSNGGTHCVDSSLPESCDIMPISTGSTPFAGHTFQISGETKATGRMEEQANGKLVEEAMKLQERALTRLIDVLGAFGRAEKLRNLAGEYWGFLGRLKKVRTAKAVRRIMEVMGRIRGSEVLQVQLCEECIEWCRCEKRTFLRHRVEARLCLLYLQQNRLLLAGELMERLLREVKQLDDKLLLVEVHLYESKLYLALKNVPRAKASLTACRASANAIHCSPILQGDIDLHSGLLHAHEKNYKTAFSYFYEAFEAFSSAVPMCSSPQFAGSSINSSLPITSLTSDTHARTLVSYSGDERNRALLALKYMLLAKIMCGQADEVSGILCGKLGLRYADDRTLEPLKELATCYQNRSLKQFKEALNRHSDALQGDRVVAQHVQELYDTMLEQNILRVLEVFSRVQIAHIAHLVELPVDIIQAKLSVMILDGKLKGTLDQGLGSLDLYAQNDSKNFAQNDVSRTFNNVLQTMKNMTDVLDSLYQKAKLAI